MSFPQSPDATRASRTAVLAARRAAGRTPRLRRVVGSVCAIAFLAIVGLPVFVSFGSPAKAEFVAVAAAYIPVLIALPYVSMSRWSVVPMLIIPLLNIVTVYQIGYRACFLPARDWPPLPSERERVRVLSQDIYILS
jgi:hypothetical protein